jgi:hypothetical protein
MQSGSCWPAVAYVNVISGVSNISVMAWRHQYWRQSSNVSLGVIIMAAAYEMAEMAIENSSRGSASWPASAGENMHRQYQSRIISCIS